MARNDSFRAGAVPPGHSTTTFGEVVKNKPLHEIDVGEAIGKSWHGGRHVKTLRATTSVDEYDGTVMHHALVKTKDRHGQERHHVVNLHADGSMLNSREGDVAGLHRHMDNLEQKTDKPTGGYFDPLPEGYRDKYSR